MGTKSTTELNYISTQSDKIAFGDSTTKNKNLPIKYNEPCKTDMCPTNIGLRCSDCKFTYRGKKQCH